MLRVISGSAKGHKLKTVSGNTTRPTTDRVKESLFNILAPFVPGASVLDLFAGTGNLGIEALSRGAESAVFVDKSIECYGIIKDNLAHTKLADKAVVRTSDAVSAVKKFSHDGKKFDIIFLDPPYSKNLVVELLDFIVKNDIIKNDSIIVAEKDKDDPVPESVGTLKLVREQRYGDTVLVFYRPICD